MLVLQQENESAQQTHGGDVEGREEVVVGKGLLDRQRLVALAEVRRHRCERSADKPLRPAPPKHVSRRQKKDGLSRDDHKR